MSASSDKGTATRCNPKSFFKLTFHQHWNFFIPGTQFVDGPGGTMKVWIKQWHTVKLLVRFEKELEDEFNLKDLIQRLRKKVNSEIAEEHTVETGHEYTAKIHEGRYGHMRYRVFGYRVGFQQWRRFGDCGVRMVGDGTVTAPTSVEGWNYWETKGGSSNDRDDGFSVSTHGVTVTTKGRGEGRAGRPKAGNGHAEIGDDAHPGDD